MRFRGVNFLSGLRPAGRKMLRVVLSVLLVFFALENIMELTDFYPRASVAELLDMVESLKHDSVLREYGLVDAPGYYFDRQVGVISSISPEHGRVSCPEQYAAENADLPRPSQVRAEWERMDRAERYAAERFVECGSNDLEAGQLEPPFRCSPMASKKVRLMLIGCSYVMGVQVGDAQTLGWRLNAALPEVQVDNFAQMGGSTYTCLRRTELIWQDLERRQKLKLGGPAERRAYDWVVYAFMSDHLRRNFSTFMYIYGKSNGCICPHAEEITDEEGTRLRYCGASPIIWPGMCSFRLINYLKEGVMETRSEIQRGKTSETYRVFNLLLDDMKARVERHGAKLAIVNLDMPTEEFERCLKRDIPHVSLFFSPYYTDKYYFSTADNHPNCTMLALWARRLQEWLPTLTGTKK